jgi:putative membrane protein
MMDFGNHMGTGGWVFSILATLIILGLIVAAVVWLVPSRRDRGSSVSATGETASEILDRRLAGGELTAEQYQQLREALSDGAQSTDGARRRFADTRG